MLFVYLCLSPRTTMLHEALLIYVLREMHLLEYIYTQDERVNLIIEYVRA